MRMHINLSIIVGAGFLVCGWVAASDLPATPFGSCVAQLGQDKPLAIKICRSKLKRALIRPGANACPHLTSVVQSKIHCRKNDSASYGANIRPGFVRYYGKLNAPVSIGSVDAFYGGRRAGAGNRFEIVRRNDGQLRIEDNDESGDSAEDCVLSSKSLRCEISGRFVGRSSSQSRQSYIYTLRMDGLLVEKKRQTRSCLQYYCSPGGCSSRCQRYSVSPFINTVSQLHSWN